MIDLNELPEDNNPELQIPANNDIGDPAFYTQQSIRAGDGEHAEFVAESPNPMVTQNVGKTVAEAMDTGGHSLNAGEPHVVELTLEQKQQRQMHAPLMAQVLQLILEGLLEMD